MKFKNRKFLLLLLLPVLAAVLLAGIILAADDERYLYFYYLDYVGDSGGVYTYNLYIKKPDTENTYPALHTGTIALAADCEEMEFEPADDWDMFLTTYPDGSLLDAETGVAAGKQYLSFTWYHSYSDPAEPLPDAYQVELGTLKVKAGGEMSASDVALLPWTDTATGKALYEASLSDELFREDLDSGWRMLSDEAPEIGYFQGFYAVDEEPGVVTVDIAADEVWQGFTVGAYAPGKDLTVEFYNHGKLDEAPVMTGVYAFETFARQKTGYFREKIDFTKLRDSGNNPLTIVSGKSYDLVLRKDSHVDVTLVGVTFRGGKCPMLNGMTLELPCGDVVRSPDNAITLKDRTKLLSLMHGGGSASGDDQYTDLDGDGFVSQTDLDILMNQRNYNKRAIEITLEGR